MTRSVGPWLVAAMIACGTPPKSDDPSTGDTGGPPANAAPLPVDDAVTLRVDTTVEITPLDNDADPDGDPLQIVEADADDGTVEIVDDATLRYAPPPGVSGADALRYTVSDGRGGTGIGVVDVEILAQPAMTLLSPSPGAELPAGSLDVVVDVEGCRLGEDSEWGCRILGTLDGEPIVPRTSETVQILSPYDGAHVLVLELVDAGEKPFDPPVTATTDWVNTGGLDPSIFRNSVTFADAKAMADFCARGFRATTGDVRLIATSAPDASDLACLEEVGGTLSVQGTTLQDLTLPALHTVGGLLRVEANHDLQRAALPALTTVGDDVSFDDDDALTELDLGDLVSVGGDLQLRQGAPSLSSLDLGSLAQVQLDVIVEGAGLAALDLPALHGARGLVTADNPALATVRADLLTTLGLDLQLLGDALATAALPLLETVGGDVRIEAPLLGQLDLGSLDLVAGSLRLTGNEVLTSLPAPGLTAVGGDLRIDDDAALAEVRLPSLSSVGGRLSLTGDDALTVIDLPVLTQLGALTVRDDPLLEDLVLLGTSAVGIDVGTNASLRTLRLPDLTSTAIGFVVQDNPVLQSVEAPRLSANLTDAVVLNGNPALTTADLSALAAPVELRVASNALTGLSLPALDQASVVEVLDEPLATLDLPLLRDVGEMTVDGCGGLTALQLPSLQSATTLAITGNDQLDQLVLSSLTTVRDELHVGANPMIGTLDLELLVDAGRLRILGNASLTEVLAPAASTAWGLDVIEDDALTTLYMPSLAALRLNGGRTTGALRIGNNDVFADLSGLSALTVIEGDLVVRDNPSLPTDDVQALADGATVGGTITIMGNL